MKRNNPGVGTGSYTGQPQNGHQPDHSNHIAAAIDRFHNYQRTRHEKEDRESAKDYWWVRGTTFFAFVAAIATGFAAVFSGLGMSAANRSAKQARRQADAAEQNLPRSWLFIETSTFNTNYEIKDQGQTRGFVFNIPFRVHNYGQSPARIKSVETLLYLPNIPEYFPPRPPPEDVTLGSRTVAGYDVREAMITPSMADMVITPGGVFPVAPENKFGPPNIWPKENQTTFFFGMQPKIMYSIPNIFIRYRIVYDDPYGRNRETCLLKSGVTLLAVEAGNNCDYQH